MDTHNQWFKRRIVRREFWMFYGVPGLLAGVWFGSLPAPSPPPPISMDRMTQRKTERNRDNLLAGDGEKGGAKSHDWKKACMVLHISFSILWWYERKKERSFIFFAQHSIQHGLYAIGKRLWNITLRCTMNTEWPKGVNVAVLRGTARIGQISPVSHPGARAAYPHSYRCHF